MASPAAALAALLALACGGSKPAPTSGPSPGAGTPAAPSTTPSSPAAPTASSGSGADSGVSFERLDAASECDALAPRPAPAPVVVHVDAGGGACTAATGDGTGALAIAVRDGAGGITWHAYAPGGGARAAFASFALVPEPSGWHGLRGSPSGAAELAVVSPDGTVASTRSVSPDPGVATGLRYDLAQDPLGGSLVLTRSVAIAGNHWHRVDGRRFDAAGQPRWPQPIALDVASDPTAPLFMAGGVSRSGDVLFLRQASAFLVADWLDGAGGNVGTSGSTERSSDVTGGDGVHDVIALKPLLDGALALRAGGQWRRVYASRATASAPLPGWLAARAAWTFQLTRGNAGYAVFPPAGQASADCTQLLELVAPSGRLCGRVTLRESGSGCTTGALDQGWDGTLVQQSGHDACTFRWWPRLLAGG
jgi:hypothetical protein